jgi:oligopeptide/dipeptide ABC transporter ATP-binding protein
MGNLLEVKELVTRIVTPAGVLRLLDRVSFNVAEHETFGLVGESGSGKSMTCRSILRILQPPAEIASGSVLFSGTDLLKIPEKEMRNIRGKGISMVFQDPMTSLNPVLSIGQQLSEALEPGLSRDGQNKAVVELLHKVGIPSPAQRAKEYPHQFSGGMRQRAMIAMALARKPRLLLADEPTTALDVTIQDQVLELLYNLQQENGMSMILVSHDLGVISQVCDHVAVMYAGEIAEIASKNDLFSQPLHPYTLGLMSSMPDLQKEVGWLRPITGMPPNLTDLPNGCRFGPRCPFATSECHTRPIDLVAAGAGRFTRCIHSDALIGVHDFPVMANTVEGKPA